MSASSGKLTLAWLHPDGRTGGRVEGGPHDGDVVWTQGLPVGTVLEHPSGDVVDAAPMRPASCPYSRGLGGRCGGCDQDRWLPDARHTALRAMVQRAYHLDELPPLTPSPRDAGTRARIQLGVGDGRVGYRAPGSHDLVPVDDCELARPEIREVLASLATLAIDDGIERVELRSDGERVAASFRRRDGIGRVELPDLEHVALDGRPIHGEPTLWLPHVGRPLRASPLAFYQVHLELNRALVDAVLAAVGAVQPERVLDLYAGVGNFSVPLAEQGVPVEAVELEGQATADLRHTASDLPHLAVVGRPAERFDPQSTPFDVAILDPPRAGAGEVMDRVLRSRPRRVVHVACDPVSGARDVARARKEGYAVASVQLFDLFPRTHHVETLTVLDRGPRPAPRRADPRRGRKRRRR